MRVSWRRWLPIVTSLVWLAPAAAEGAMCPGDNWGGRSAAISLVNAEQARIIAQTNVIHWGTHPICQGNFTARAVMLGMGADCSTGGDTKTHFPSGADSLAYSERTCFIPQCGFTYWTGGIHSGFGEAEHYTESSNSINISCPCQPPPQGCTLEGEVWSYELCECVDSCPLVIDATGRGYRLTNAADGVRFDLNADGVAEQISWTDPRRDVAFLALDRNGNGRIDDGEELFGNTTPIAASDGPRRAVHGFDALAALEGPEYGRSRPDGVIDRHDAAYAKVLLWVDRNHDGRAQRGELASAASHGLIALETRYRESRRRDRHGNEFRLRGISWWERRPGDLQARLFYDVWLVARQ